MPIFIFIINNINFNPNNQIVWGNYNYDSIKTLVLNLENLELLEENQLNINFGDEIENSYPPPIIRKESFNLFWIFGILIIAILILFFILKKKKLYK